MLGNNFGQQHPVTKGTCVDIPMIPWTIYRDPDLEPQPTTAKDAPSSLLYIDTDDLPNGANRADFVISNNIQYLSNVGRLTFVGCGVANWWIPNVNPRNNLLRVMYGGVPYSVPIPVGWYDYTTPNVLAAAIQLALDTHIIPGWTVTAISNYPAKYTIDAPGAVTFYFIDEDANTALTKGDTVFGFETTQNATLTKTVGPMLFKYTRYVDVCSTVLTKYAKLRSITTNSRSRIFARAFIGGEKWGDTFYAAPSTEAFQFSFRPAEVVTSIDIQLYDSHGDPLYIPPEIADSILFSMTVKCEM